MRFLFFYLFNKHDKTTIERGTDTFQERKQRRRNDPWEL